MCVSVCVFWFASCFFFINILHGESERKINIQRRTVPAYVYVCVIRISAVPRSSSQCQPWRVCEHIALHLCASFTVFIFLLAWNCAEEEQRQDNHIHNRRLVARIAMAKEWADLRFSYTMFNEISNFLIKLNFRFVI